MHDAPTSPEDPAGEAETAERVARQLAMLRELAELGMGMARAICADAQAPAGVERRFAGDLALMFSRVSKAIRMTLVLEARLAEDLRTAGARRGEPVPRAQSAPEALDPTNDRDEAEAVETPQSERNERLTDPNEFARLDDRPIADWVAVICEHLGVPFDPELWVDEGQDAAPHPRSEAPQSLRPLDPSAKSPPEKVWPGESGNHPPDPGEVRDHARE